MSKADPFAAIDKLDDALVQMIAVRLEARGRHPYFSRMLHEYLDAMRLETARTVLDLGCGTASRRAPSRSAPASPAR